MFKERYLDIKPKIFVSDIDRSSLNPLGKKTRRFNLSSDQSRSCRSRKRLKGNFVFAFSSQRNEVQSLHSNRTDSLKHYGQESDQLHTQLKSQTRTIQILIEEKSQLEDKAKSLGETVEEKGKEIEELKGRLAISKHKCANIERDVGILQDQVKQSSRVLSEMNEMMSQER